MKTDSPALEAVKSAMNEIKIAQKELAERAVAALPGAMEAIFSANAGLKWVRLLGYTPGFNDGDPCTHSMRVDVEGWDGELPEQEVDEWEIEKCLAPLEVPLEQAWGTNWQILVQRQENGTVKISDREEYYCGH